MSDNPYALLSFWGYLLAFDAGNQRAYFRPLQFVSNDEISTFSSCQTSGVLSEFAVRGRAPCWQIEPGTLTGCVSIVSDGLYVSCNKEGLLLSTDNKHAWENFLFISLDDVIFLRSVILSRFRSAGIDSGEAPKLGLQNFDLVWDDRLFPLHLNCPLSQRFDSKAFRIEFEGGGLVLEKCPAERERSVIWINPLGSIGNRALQYLTAEGIRDRAPEAEIRNIRLEMFGINLPAPRPRKDSCASTGDWCFSIDTRGLGDCLRRGEVEAVAIESYTFCLDHYPSREKCRQLLPAAVSTEHVIGFGENALLCNVRGGEILLGVEDYIPLPVRYYQLLEEESGLDMVFYGQIGDDPYSENLRRHFPHAQFIRSQGQEVDFEIIRKSKNIAIAISTFSWLASYLSHAQRIYVPVGGMFNPVQVREQYYLPVDDPAFHFVLLPLAKGVSLYEQPDEFWAIQERLSKALRFAPRAEIHELGRRMTTWPVSKRVMTGPFDADYYGRRHTNAAVDVMALKTTALDHYLRAGHQCGDIVAFDPLFYGDTYPDAEADVALGRFANLFHHFMFKGWQLGYLPRAVQRSKIVIALA